MTVHKELLYALLIAALAMLGHPAIADECLEAQLTTTAASPFLPAAFGQEIGFEKNADRDAQVLILGDSIARGFPTAIARRFGSVANAGLSGSIIQNTLWQIERIKSYNLHPSTVIIISGTNNLTLKYSVCGIVAGLTKIIQSIDETWHPEKIILFDIPPRGSRGEAHADERTQIAEALRHSQVLFTHLAIDPSVVCAIGGDCKNYLPDNLHFTVKGYEFFAEALRAAYPQDGAPKP